MVAGLARAAVLVVLALAAGAAAAQQPGAPAGPNPPLRRPVQLEKLTDIALAMEVCWRANLPARRVPGMTIRVMVAFKRNGEMFGEPKFTFATPGVPTDTKAVYQRAAAAAVARCDPLPFSEGLGNAAAGRPWVFEFIDRRSEKGI
jgi:hypothetical protein